MIRTQQKNATLGMKLGAAAQGFQQGQQVGGMAVDAAGFSSTVLRSAPPQLGHEAIMRPVTEPLAPLLCVHPAAGRSGVAVGSAPAPLPGNR